jgi:plastocyanin
MRDLRRLLVVVSFIALVALAGCGGGTPAATPSGGTGGTGTGTSGTGSSSSAVSVSLKNFAFVPADITVAVGGTVTFTNNDSTTHDVVGDSFDSGPMAQGATFSQTFATAGTFPIHCSIHPSMTANVTVK